MIDGHSGGWQALDEELARWAALGRRCPVWLRDDDAVADTPALRRLLRLCGEAGIPLGLAVIAAAAEPSLIEPLAEPLTKPAGGRPEVALLVHGWAHANHAAAGEKKCEFGPGRPAEARRTDAVAALDRLRGLYGERLLPLFVPPWNRMAPDMPDLLADAGFRAVSAFGDRRAAERPAGLRWLNTHLDLIDWHGGRSAVAPEPLLDALRRHLANRREGRRDPEEPIGLLTHHLVHDAAIWGLLEALLDRLAGHPALRWPTIPEMMGPETMGA